jgi:uncharacterized iron-regulated protein
MRHTPIAIVFLVSLASCRLVDGSSRIVEAPTGKTVELEHAIDRLAECDVVFLGEEHDNDEAHRLQIEITRGLLARRGEIAISMEMFERDVQGWVDRYVGNRLDEDVFLAHSRPWPNYAEHYRPAVELARENGLDLLAANCPRPLASRIAHEGLSPVLGDPWCAHDVESPIGEYKARFASAMATHQGNPGEEMDRWFEAQCAKDDTMAETIANYLDARGKDAPLVVHWCGKFHSDHGLGTVERLRRRKPDLRIGIVSTLSGGKLGRALDDDEKALGDYVMRVPGM